MRKLFAVILMFVSVSVVIGIMEKKLEENRAGDGFFSPADSDDEEDDEFEDKEIARELDEEFRKECMKS